MRVPTQYTIPLKLLLVPLGLLLALIFRVPSGAQESQANQVVRDPQAISVLRSAIRAIGGRASLSNIQDTTMEGVSVPSDTSGSTERFVWESRGMDIRKESNASDGQSVFVIYQSKGTRFPPGNESKKISGRSALALIPFEVPGSILLQLLNDPYRSLELVSETEAASDGVASVPHTGVHMRTQRKNLKTGYAATTQQDWYFDPTTGIPLCVDFVLPDLKQPSLDGTASVLYDSWQEESGVQFPRQLQMFTDGVLQYTMTVSSIHINQGLNTTHFQAR
jgi:hypothetical protein